MQVTALSEGAFEQRRVAVAWGQRGHWNSARRHHLDPLQVGCWLYSGSGAVELQLRGAPALRPPLPRLQLTDGTYLAAMDGDSQPSGPISSRMLWDAGLLAALWGAVLTVWAVQHWRGRTGYAAVGSLDARRAGLQLSHVEMHLT